MLLTAGRNIVSKGMTTGTDGKKSFFFGQMLLFFVGGATIFCLNPAKCLSVSVQILPYSLIYGVLLCSAQGLYVLALKKGNTSVCVLVYSFGFLIPTVLGAVCYNEDFGITKYIGLLMAIATLILTANTEKREGADGKYFIPLLGAMLSSGGLGVMQKVQQKSAVSDMTNEFLFVAFSVAFLVSAIGFFMARGSCKPQKNYVLRSSVVGICFGGANYLNTVLAGKMESSVFFPTQNIGSLVLSILLSILIFKEKISLPKAIGLLLGIAAIVVLKL